MKTFCHIILLFVFTNAWAGTSDIIGIKDLIDRSNKFVQQNNYEEGINYANKAIDLSQKIRYVKGLADSYYLKGFAQSRSNQLDSAKGNLLMANAYYALIHDTTGKHRSIDAITDIYYWKGDAYFAQWLRTLNGDDLEFKRMKMVFFFSLYMGALVFCLIYVLFLYRFTNDKAYKEMAKSITAFIFFIYTTNNEFAIQFNRNLLHFTLMDLLKNYSIIFGTYFFANFLEELLSSKKEILPKYFRFLKAYKKVVIGWFSVTTVLITLVMITSHTVPWNYFRGFLLWFIVNDLFGLLLTLLLFTMLFIYAYKKDVRINYLVYGFILNVIFLCLSTGQAIAGTRFSHIPYPHALGSVLFLIFMTVAITDKINSYRREKEEAQENALKHLEGLVAERTRDLKHQKELIEEKQTQIIDSINYAKRLQQALLVSEQDLAKHFKEIFVIYKPKDIVSGDFYWFSESDSNRILAVGDCTGHGVPGALMCMLGNECLQDVALRKDIETTASALRSLDIKITETLNKSDRTFRDGMDIALCAFSKETNTLQFSGANRPLIQITDGKMIEHKPDKQSIGGNIDRTEKNYHTTLINCKSGDTFYLFTDGYADQFGGPKGKKFKHKTLKDILFDTSKLSLKEQSAIINYKFDEWKGNLEQVDDVCIIGIRI